MGRITQASCNWHNSVMWKFIKYRNRWIIQNKNGYVLDNYAFKKNNGAPIYAWNRNNKNNQKWKIISLGKKKFELKGNHSNKCLDNTGKAKSGVGYHQWDCNKRNKNQHFSIMKRARRNKRTKKSHNSRTPKGWGMIKGKGNFCVQAT